MYTLGRTKTLHNCLGLTVAAVLTAIFGAVYEHFSHEVYSNYMIYAFAIPLVLGTLPLMCILVFGIRTPDGTALRIYNSGIAALTVGSLFEGVLEIYGTTNRLIVVYPIVGIFLMVIAIIIYTAHRKKEIS